MSNGIKKPLADEWTIGTYAVYQETIREAEERFQAERDRRYSELAAEREKALSLANKLQEFKNEQMNNLRQQLAEERSLYITREEYKGVTDYILTQRGRDKGIGLSAGVLGFGITTAIAVGGLIGYLVK